MFVSSLISSRKAAESAHGSPSTPGREAAHGRAERAVQELNEGLLSKTSFWAKTFFLKKRRFWAELSFFVKSILMESMQRIYMFLVVCFSLLKVVCFYTQN